MKTWRKGPRNDFPEGKGRSAGEDRDSQRFSTIQETPGLVLGSQHPTPFGSCLCSSTGSSRPPGSYTTEVFTFISKGWIILAFSSSHKGLGWNEQTARGASSSRGKGWTAESPLFTQGLSLSDTSFLQRGRDMESVGVCVHVRVCAWLFFRWTVFHSSQRQWTS